MSDGSCRLAVGAHALLLCDPLQSEPGVTKCNAISNSAASRTNHQFIPDRRHSRYLLAAMDEQLPHVERRNAAAQGDDAVMDFNCRAPGDGRTQGPQMTSQPVDQLLV